MKFQKRAYRVLHYKYLFYFIFKKKLRILEQYGVVLSKLNTHENLSQYVNVQSQ